MLIIVDHITRNLTVAFRASGKSFSQKLVTARLMYLIRACGTAHLERRTRDVDAGSGLVVARLIYVIGCVHAARTQKTEY